MNNNLYKCPICGGPSNYSSINYQPKPCLHCSAIIKPADQQHGNDPHAPSYRTLFDAVKPNEQTAPAPTPWEVKEGYWHEQYQLMREKFWKQIGENSKLAERIVQLEAALRSIVNGDILTSRERAKMVLEGTYPPVDEKPEQEAESHGNVKDPFYFKGYWYQEYLEMREKYWERTHENSQQADRIRELQEHSSKQDFFIDELADSLRAMVAHCEGFISNLKESK